MVHHGPAMIRLELAGANTRIHAALCSACPQGPAGCCAAPPAVAWADLGRIVTLGGAAWLLDELRAGRLRPSPRGLAIQRVAPAEIDGRAWPGRCVYLGATGCTILPERRSATCNYYVCDDALARGDAEGEAAAREGRAAHEVLEHCYGEWDREIGERVAATWPDGPTWDEAFLQWLSGEAQRLIRRDRRALRRLEQRA